MKKLVVSDFDGTFYRNEEEIVKNIEAVKKFKEKGNLFLIATGRSYDDFEKMNQMFRIPCDYLILNNGATILNREKQVLYTFYIDEKIKNKVVDDLDLEQNTDIDFYFCCSGLESRVSPRHEKLTKIAIYYKDHIDVSKIRDDLVNCYGDDLTVTLGTNHNIEIAGRNTSKATAIQYLLKHMNLSKDHVYVIGDSDNDAKMIQEFHGNCVENASDQIKQISSGVYISFTDYLETIS